MRGNNHINYNKNDKNNQYYKYDKFKVVNIKERINARSLSPNSNNKRNNRKNPFAVASQHKTNFGYVYSSGGIPCRLDFTGAKMKLKWSIPPAELNYEPTLEICFEGLMETVHPYCFAARQCIREMISAENAQEKILPILPKLLIILRQALTNDLEMMFLEAMDIINLLSKLFKKELNKYLNLILLQINRRSFKVKYRERVFDLLRDLEVNGGEEALLLIKNKIPTYNTML